MDVTINTSMLTQLNNDLKTVGRSLDRSVVGPALVDAAKPLLIAAEQEAPIGKIPRYKSTLVSRGKSKGQTRRITGSFARGGATRRDVRLRSVDGNGAEVARVLVGVSKKSGKVGWRTQFLRKNFIRLAYNRTVDVVELRLMNSLTQTVAKVLARAAR